MRKTLLRATAAATLFAVAAALSGAEYALDEAHSNVQFSVPLLGLSKVTGKFMRYDAHITAGKARDLSQAKVTAVIETASIATGSDSWDGKLRTPAFFDSQKYPEIRFESRRVRKVKGKWEAVGPLSIHGVSREITLPFEIKGRYDGPHPDDRIGISARFE
ncbi:MAG TPA: YceI family protein, partial [Thermoanaerobaculia bacterium]|nr:YceI family protein [Thermoanaerobaculia bacterium]